MDKGVQLVRLIHFSQEPVIELRYVDQPGDDSDYVRQLGSLAKPMGLWLSDEDSHHSWSAHCVNNGRPERLGLIAQEVLLAASAQIVHIENAVQLDIFTSRYRASGYNSLGLDVLIGRRIDWAKVAKEYQGIAIVPYIKARALDPHAFWYKLWDCASACIWDPKAIELIKEVKL